MNKFLVFALACLSTVALLSHCATAQNPTTLVATTLLTSCTDTSASPALPNLSFGERTVTYSFTGTTECTSLTTPNIITNTPLNLTYDWYYYQNYDPAQNSALGQCNHNVATSTVQISTVQFASTGNGQVTQTSVGRVVAGAYLNANVDQTAVLTGNYAACNTAVGLEASSGTVTLVITGGPTCTGILTHQYCPGARNTGGSIITTTALPVTVPPPTVPAAPGGLLGLLNGVLGILG